MCCVHVDACVYHYMVDLPVLLDCLSYSDLLITNTQKRPFLLTRFMTGETAVAIKYTVDHKTS